MLTIGQAASRAGLRASAIRYYEAQGLLPAAFRHAGKRVYDDSILDRLAMIALAKAAGFEIAEIRAVLSMGDEKPALIWRKLARAKHAELDERIARLVRMEDVLAKLSGCPCATLEECGRAFNLARSQQLSNPPHLQRPRLQSSVKLLMRRGSRQ